MPITDLIYDKTYESGGTISISSSPARILIKSGTYAGFSIGASLDSGLYIEIEDDTTFTSAITVSGDKITLKQGTCVTHQGVLTLAGAECSLISANGSTFNLGATLSGAKCCFDGGGYNTESLDTISVSNSDDILCNVKINTKSGATTNSAIAFSSSTLRCKLYNIMIEDSDHFGVEGDTSSSFNLTTGIYVKDSDSRSIDNPGIGAIVYANNITSNANTRGISTDQDDVIICGNTARNASLGDQIRLGSTSDRAIISGNRAEGITSTGTNAIINNNETGTF